MTTRRRIWIFVLLAIVIAALAFWFTRSREPRYQGKRFSVWLDEYQMALANEVAPYPPPEPLVVMRNIGTNAIPFLIEELQAQDSQWKLKLDGWFKEKFGWERKSISASDRQNDAQWGFGALGKLAEPAIPKLSALITNSQIEVATAALAALSRIESQKALPPLISALTNQNSQIRRSAAFCFLFHPSVDDSAVATLLKTLNDSDPAVARVSASILGTIACDPKQVIPALTEKLNNTDPRVRAAAAGALGSFGTNAIAALPALQQLLENANPRGRMFIARSIVRVQCEIHDGGIVRGPKDEKKIAIVFTGHEFAEGGDTILTGLTNHQAKASFFLTGTFLRNPNYKTFVERIVREDHCLGPHSDKHLLYCSWENPPKTLVERGEFEFDLANNMQKVANFLNNSQSRRYFLPAYEHYNREIAQWARTIGSTLINYTPGTRSNADYTGEADKNFVSSQKIFDSIVKHEQEDPNGLNGFILLLHIGVGPNRADKFHNRFGELLDHLAAKGYQFVRVDELLEPKDDASFGQRPFPNPNGPFRRR